MSPKFLNEKKERDLFDYNAQGAEKKIRKKVKFLLPPLKNNIVVTYENIIFIIIVYIMSSIIFFSLGVEKGREDLGYIKKDVSSAPLVKLIPKQEETPKKAEENKDNKEEYSPYIIRLASFSEESTAVREKKNLKKDGYEASIRKSGNYYQLYIGGFTNREKAVKLQQALTARYKDCYITKN